MAFAPHGAKVWPCDCRARSTLATRVAERTAGGLAGPRTVSRIAEHQLLSGCLLPQSTGATTFASIGRR